MEQQQVYPGGYGIRLIHQNPDEQQASYIMASHQENNQILIADESTGQHIVPHIQQQQYIQQQQDDGNQYLIQQQSQAPQQVFYANIQQTQPNVNRIIHQQQAQGGNLMQQQTPQKVKTFFISRNMLIISFVIARCIASTTESNHAV
jgi:hypothetical protein